MHSLYVLNCVCICLFVCPHMSMSTLYSHTQEVLSTSSQPSCACAVCLLCPGEGGAVRPRAGLIGVKQASLKSHQRLGTLRETGNLLFGDFLQLHDSVCPCLSYCLSPYPSLLKSLITAQFPSALFLSHLLSTGFKHLLLITCIPHPRCSLSLGGIVFNV